MKFFVILHKNKQLNMRKPLLFLFLVFALTACRDSIDDRAEKEARDYTRKYCPTPVVNHTFTDSLVYDRQARTYIYYCKLTDVMDDDSVINANRTLLHDGLKQSLKESTNLKVYKDAGINFKYVIRSQKDPTKTLFEAKFPAEEL